MLTAAAVLGAAACSEPEGPRGRPRPAPDMPLVGDILCLSVHVPLGDSADDVAERTRQLDHVEALGVRMIRRDFLWHRLEPNPDELHWEGVDPGGNEILDRGLTIIPILAYGVPWASS